MRKHKRKVDTPMELSEVARADRETAVTYAGTARTVLVCTTIQKDITDLIRKGWEDVTPKGGSPYRWFRAARTYLTFRTVKKGDRR